MSSPESYESSMPGDDYFGRVAEIGARVNCSQYGPGDIVHEVPIREPSGEAWQVKIPFDATVNGEPRDVLATVGVAPWMPQPRRDVALQKAAEGSVRNYAIMRRPYDSDAPLEVALLTKDEAMAGKCDLGDERQPQMLKGRGLKDDFQLKEGLQMDISLSMGKDEFGNDSLRVYFPSLRDALAMDEEEFFDNGGELPIFFATYNA